MARSNGPHRVFLGWERPGLLAAAEAILARASGDELDLSRLVVVLPGARACRNLGALLLARASEQRRPLSPPLMITPGAIVDVLLGLDGPAPGDLARRFAWVEALRATDADVLRPLAPNLPAEDDLGAWGALAAVLARCHAELAGEGLRFADIPERARRAGLYDESDRWAAAAAVQERYDRLLERQGWPDPDLARLRALEEETPAAEREIILVGVADLPATSRDALRRAGPRATVLVLAPEALADRFDEFGCVRPEAWAEARVPLRDEQVIFADSPAQQAERALEAIAALGGRLAADQVSIGVPDESVVPFLERLAEQARGVRLRRAAGTPLSRTAPWKVLETVADHLERGTLRSLCALVRHPDVERWLVHTLRDEAPDDAGAEWWLEALDCYCAEHLPGRHDGTWLVEEGEQRRALEGIGRAVAVLLGELGAPEGAPARPAGRWAAPVLALLRRVYGDRPADADDESARATVSACAALADAARELHDLATCPHPPRAPISAAQALRMLLRQTADVAVPADPDPEAIELLGWLELPLDPSEATIITGLNEGVIPAPFGGDPFLPESLREALGLDGAAKRYARDAYVLSAIAASRRHVVAICGRRSADDDPLWPSRLLLAAEPESAIARLRRFAVPHAEPPPRVRLARRIAPGRACCFPVAPVALPRAVPSMAVTSFKTYLASPYLFYLKHVLRLDERDDDAVELDPLAFGSLIHEVLELFASCDDRHADDPARIEQCLQDGLTTIASRRYGDRPSAAVWLQLQAARRRLRDLARWQAERVREGWLIATDPEWRPGDGAALIVDGEPMPLRGRIDRIERNHRDGRLAILDFKTGDRVSPPDTAHRGRNGWRDLQLPLYRHLAAALGPDDSTVLGYVAVPRRPGGVQLLQASWDRAALAEADEAAAGVVRAVRRAEFADVGRAGEDGVFAALCGTGFLGGRPGLDGEEDEP